MIITMCRIDDHLHLRIQNKGRENKCLHLRSFFTNKLAIEYSRALHEHEQLFFTSGATYEKGVTAF